MESLGGDRRGGEFGWRQEEWRVWVEIGGVESLGRDRRSGEFGWR